MSEGPWGQQPSGPPRRGPRSKQPPGRDELIRKSKDWLNQALQGGGSSGSGFSRNLWMAIALIIGLAWAYMSTNVVDPDENGLVLRLGAYNRTAGPGLHFVLWPIERMELLPVEAENQINLGGGNDEALTLASDQNLVDIRFSVLLEDQERPRFPLQYYRSGGAYFPDFGQRHARDRWAHPIR